MAVGANSATPKLPTRELISYSLQYLYFLRFSIVFWLLVPVLALLDNYTAISALTRGIFTPALGGQFFGAAFFIVCSGMVALVNARLVCFNGEQRFVTPPPPWLANRLGPDSDKNAVTMLLASQIPGALVLLYLHRNAFREDVAYDWPGNLKFAVFTVLGILAALIFWWFLNTIYYWTYSYADYRRPARTLLFPRSFFGLRAIDDETPSNYPFPTIEEENFVAPPILPWLWKQIARLGPGYADKERVGEGHRFAAIALIGFLAIYTFLFPLTAPVPQPHGYIYALVGASAVFTLIAFSFSRTTPGTITPLKAILVCLFAMLAVSSLSFLAYGPGSIRGFPVLASFLVLMTILAFIFSAIAFWADRHRIPVVTTFFAYLWISHALFSHAIFLRQFFSRSGEHYFHAAKTETPSPPLQPAQILQSRRCMDTNGSPTRCPIIVVTSAGGGLHAAAWTAMVLTTLETGIHDDPFLQNHNFTFHDHLLYASTVSGGSVGLLPFLREYYSPTPFRDANWAGRVRRAANCSSLEAVGWGLEYSDFLHAVLPFLSPSPDHDRSAALEKAFLRNLTSKKCDPRYNDDPNPDAPQLTLAGTALDLKHRSGSQSPPTFPAFTFNTTAVETGGRFLLANYVNNEDESSPNGYQSREGVLPAESFLAAYGQAETKHASADIQLVTAARLSGTFPYVSSAARIDPAFAPQADHFVDGGYFDNDGTSSAIEFLEAAFANPVSDPIPVLFIEIRDGPDLNPNISDESFASQQSLLANQSPWGMFNQILAPPKGFWQSGHVSVTRRDRRELERLMESLKDRASFKHIVFDYTDPVNAKEPLKVRRRPSAQPLSWHLTPSQIANVNTSIGELQPCLAQVIEWAHLSLSSTSQSNEPSVSCNHSQALKSVPSP